MACLPSWEQFPGHGPVVGDPREPSGLSESGNQNSEFWVPEAAAVCGTVEKRVPCGRGPWVSCGGPRRVWLRARLCMHRARLTQAYQVEAAKGQGAKQQPELSSADPAGEGGSSMPDQRLHIQTRPQRMASG